MANLVSGSSTPQPPDMVDRLDSWKEIAAYLKRDVRTVQRWEREGLPIHRQRHDKLGSIYAYRSEIDEWRSRGRKTARPKPKSPWYLLAILVIGAVPLAGYISKWFSGFRKLDLADVRISKLTDNGRAQYVAISPDGRYVVYALAQGDEQSLRLRQVSTRRDVELLGFGPSFHGLTFSPDGSYVYFVRSKQEDPNVSILYSIPALGGPSRKIMEDVDSPVTFSPDGRRFAFERGIPERNVVELKIANADGGSQHVLATIRDGDIRSFLPGPSWSREGRAIVAPVPVLGKERRWILESVSVPDGRVREIYSGPDALGHPVWLSQYRLLVPHYSSAYQRTQLWVISHPEGSARQFTNDLTNYDQPLDATRDGSTVVAISSTTSSNIWVTSADNLSNPRQITSGELALINVAETADGRIVSASEDGRLWTVPFDGGQREPFTDIPQVAWLTRCGPFVLYASFGVDAVSIRRVNADGSHETKLITGDVRHPACSPDGRYVFYVSGHWPQKIWRMSNDGSSPIEIASIGNDGVAGPLDISADGALLSYPCEKDPPGWELTVRPTGGGAPVKTFKVPGGIRRVHWSPSGNALQYLVTQHGATNIWEQPLAEEKPKQLTAYSSGRIFDFTWSSDHKRLFLTRGEVTSDAVILSNLR